MMGMEDFLLGSSNFSGANSLLNFSWVFQMRPGNSTSRFQASLGHAESRATVVSYGSALSAMEQRGVWQEVGHPRRRWWVLQVKVTEILQDDVHPRNLTWNLKISPWKRKVHLETIIFRFHVKFRGCRLY